MARSQHLLWWRYSFSSAGTARQDDATRNGACIQSDKAGNSPAAMVTKLSEIHFARSQDTYVRSEEKTETLSDKDIGMIIGPSNTMARVTATTTSLGSADPAAADSFKTLMGTSAPDAAAAKPQATDAQINSLSKGELNRLRDKWGANEVGFREDAYNAWKFGQAYQNTVIQQMFQESYTRTRDIVKEQAR